MKIKLRLLFIIPALFFALFFTSCNDDDGSSPPVLQSSQLYDTLGWFIQGNADLQVEGQGTKYIDDPNNQGEQIQAGRLAIRKVVHKGIMVIAADPHMAKYFPTLLNEVTSGNTTGFAMLQKNLTDFVQQAVSGQQVYEGLNMVEAHKHSINPRFGSTDQPTVTSHEDFDRFVGDVATAAESLNVPPSVIAQLGAILNTTEDAVVSP